MDDEEKNLFLPTIPQRTVPVWIPTCDDDDDDDYDDDGAGVDSNLRSNVFQSQFSVEGPKNQHSSIVHDFKDLEKLPHPHINTLVTVCVKIFDRPENRKLLIREIL